MACSTTFTVNPLHRNSSRESRKRTWTMHTGENKEHLPPTEPPSGRPRQVQRRPSGRAASTKLTPRSLPFSKVTKEKKKSKRSSEVQSKQQGEAKLSRQRLIVFHQIICAFSPGCALFCGSPSTFARVHTCKSLHTTHRLKTIPMPRRPTELQ